MSTAWPLPLPLGAGGRDVLDLFVNFVSDNEDIDILELVIGALKDSNVLD
jgi:hypothetical protein